MRLLRVQVPEFRALKDVDISFEPDFTPQVFPLGSLNGGGKSTLLQLIFVLLNQASSYFTNLFSDITLDGNSDYKKLATITVLIDNEKIELSYFFCKSSKMNFFQDSVTENYKMGFQFNNGVISIFGMAETNKVITQEEVNYFFKKASNSIFLISPSNQPYLFLPREARRDLFNTNKEKYSYFMRKLPEDLPNFFTFDFVDVLVEVFRRARAKDFKERNKDNPFAHTEKLESDINSLFIDGKKISSLIIEQQRHTEDEIQGIFFTLPSGQKIYPEDLSHGELKRLAIFVLIKYHEMQDAIVLIDEIENGFHPDWQYTIVRNLVEWGKNNQYILATHSYELCTAVTPAHVKELEPRLTK